MTNLIESSPISTEQLYGDLYENLHRFVRRRVACEADADDIVHDVFIRIHTNAHQLATADSISGWIYRVTRNAIADHHRGRAASVRALERYGQEPLAGLADGDTDPVRETTELIGTCLPLFIDELPEDFRQAILLTDMGGMTQKEAAEKLGLSVSGMKSRVQRGRAKLGQLLHQCCTFELDARSGVMGYQQRQNMAPPTKEVVTSAAGQLRTPSHQAAPTSPAVRRWYFPPHPRGSCTRHR